MIDKLTIKGLRMTVGLALIFAALAVPALAQRPKPAPVAVVDGDTVYQVLPADAIPAIRQPQFVTGSAAERQMAADEPVLAFELNGEFRAYSLWQLDTHEIVDDRVGDTPVAVTW